MVKKKPKIAIFHCGFTYSGGGERIVLEEAKELKKRGYQVVVYAPTINPEISYSGFLKELGVKTFLPSFTGRLPYRDALRMALSSLLAPFLAFQFREIDLFVGANQPGAWLAYWVAKVLGKPYLVYLNQPNRLVYPRKIDQQAGWQTRKDYYLLANLIKKIKPFVVWADKISFTSGKTMLVNGNYISQSIKRIYKRPVVLCPGGAHPQAWSKLKLNPGSAFKGGFKIKGTYITKPYALITNRHEPQKRFDYVIRAMEQVNKKAPQASLIIPSPFTSHTAELINLSKRLKLDKKVLFLGQISEDDLQKLYWQAAVYCYPSPDEDFGLGPLEAGAWGVPTVAWNHGGPTVTVIHGKTGYLAKPYQVEDYAQGMMILLSDPKKRAQMGKAAWERVKNYFSWDKHLDILEEEIKKNLSMS